MHLYQKAKDSEENGVSVMVNMEAWKVGMDNNMCKEWIWNEFSLFETCYL